jgi:Bacteriophage protein gp37
MAKTGISYATDCLNFYRGEQLSTWACTKVSAGCKNCYMFAMAAQYKRPVSNTVHWRGDAAIREYAKLKAGDVVFVNSMSDTYHETASFRYVQTIHNLILLKPDVTFLMLTKRPIDAMRFNMVGHSYSLPWPDNLWFGVSIENKAVMESRLNALARIPARHKFLSVEPLLESLLPDLTGVLTPGEIEWMIVGGESGRDRRPFDKQWAVELRDFCAIRNIHFTYKQGSALKPGKDNVLDGITYLDTPFTDGE